MSEPKTRHLYDRPQWRCLTDGEPWPCKERRLQFLTDYRDRKAHLKMLMGTFLLDALAECDDPPEEIYHRFLGWIEPSSLHQQSKPTNT